MRILKNVTQEELNYLNGQPTAKQIRERNLQGSGAISNGDKVAAAKFTRERDTVEISREAYALQAQEKDITAAFGDYPIPVTKGAQDGNFVLHFNNSAILHRVVEKGALKINGKEVAISDETKRQLVAADETARKMQEQAVMQSVMQYNAVVMRQQSDALQTMSAQQSRTMGTASRIMHGKKVSPADEKELMETNPELYAMAKSAAQLARHQKHGDEDEGVSRRNDAARAEEAQPKDYSTPEINPETYETQMEVAFDGETIQMQAVTVGVAET